MENDFKKLLETHLYRIDDENFNSKILSELDLEKNKNSRKISFDNWILNSLILGLILVALAPFIPLNSMNNEELYMSIELVSIAFILFSLMLLYSNRIKPTL